MKVLSEYIPWLIVSFLSFIFNLIQIKYLSLENIPTTENPVEPLQQPVPTKTKKGFLRSLLCCLRQKKTKTQFQDQSVVGSTYSERNRGAYLLKPALPEDAHKKCMVIDLDETLVHSSFKVSLIVSNFFWKYLKIFI